MKPQISALGSEIISLAHFIYRKRRSGTGKGDIMGYKCWEDESRVFIKFRSRLGFDRWIKKKLFMNTGLRTVMLLWYVVNGLIGRL